MKDDDSEIAIKIVIVGNGVVGKSSMIQRFCKGIFTNEYKKTLGVDFLERVIRVGPHTVRLMLWDTAGQEEFEALTKAYYRGAHACAIVFSTTDRESFRSVESWKKKVEYECGEIPTALVQNKIDLLNESTIKRDDVDTVVKRHKWKYIKTSVKDNVNVDNVFHFLAECYINSLNDECSEEPVPPHLSLYPSNASYLSPPIIPSQSVSNNPLFNPVYGHTSKYRKKGNNGVALLNHAIPSQTGGNGIVNHYRYKSKFSIIPMRQQNPTILLHHHRQFHYHHHQALHHNYHYIANSDKPNNKPFKSCKIF